MKKLLLLTMIFAIGGGIGFGQTASAPVVTNTLPPEKVQKKPFNPADLVGLKGQTAPQFILSAMNGTEYNLEKLRGKIIVINLWGTFCAPCIKEMPELNSLVEKYKDKEVVFLAPSPEGKEILEAFLRDRSFHYQVLRSAFGVVREYAPHRKSETTNKINDFMMIFPTHLIIDQTGTVTYHNWGYSKTTVAELTNEIENLLTPKK